MAKNGVDDRVENAAEDISKELKELGRELRKRADDVRKESAKQLNEAARSIRKEVRKAPGDDEALQRADELARNLEKAASYLGSRSFEQMGDDATRVVRRYPMRAVIITFVVGALIGLWLRGDYKD